MSTLRPAAVCLMLCLALCADDIQFPESREISDAFARVQNLLKDGDRERAIELLEAITEQPVADQVFVEDPGSDVWVGCVRRARTALLALRQRPATVAEAEARRERDALSPDADDAALLAIIERFPRTEVAGWLRVRLGDRQFERGDVYLARLTWEAQLTAATPGIPREELQQRLALLGGLPPEMVSPRPGQSGDKRTSAVYDGRTIVLLDKGELIAIDATRKRRIWMRDDLGPIGGAIVAAAFGRVGVLTGTRLLLLSAEDGQTLADHRLEPGKLDIQDGSIPAGLVLLNSGGAVLVFNSPPPRCEVYSVSLPADGKLVRSSYLLDCDGSRLPLEVSVGPDGEGDVLVHIALKGALITVRGSTGELLWARRSERPTLHAPNLSWHEGMLCARLEKDELHGLHPSDGSPRFAITLEAGELAVGRSGPVVLTSKERALLLDLKTGRRVGLLDFNQLQISPSGRPRVVRGWMWVPVRGGLVRVELDSGEVVRHRLKKVRNVELLSYGKEVFAVSGRRFEVFSAD